VTAREFHLPVQTHGHYLVAGPESEQPLPLVVGFHGYAETAAVHLEALRQIPVAPRVLSRGGSVPRAPHRLGRGAASRVPREPFLSCPHLDRAGRGDNMAAATAR
jgi:hypothetical protein